MELYLDTSNATHIIIRNNDGNIVDEYSDDMRFSQSEKLLQAVDDLLKKNALNKDCLKSIVVFCGPGSYTGIRVGVTTANFLALGLNIPVFCSEEKGSHSPNFTKPVSAKYLKEPFITKEKSRLN